MSLGILDRCRVRQGRDGKPFVLLLDRNKLVAFRPGCPVAVSLDAGRTWCRGELPVHSLAWARRDARRMARDLRGMP